jgi:hypothetical protein
VSEITGVVTTRPAVFEQELRHIVAADREYVASEMNAFLVCWLSSLPCNVVNRPTPGCLFGPAWRIEQWLGAAARIGIPINANNASAARRGEDVGAFIGGCSVTVVGEQLVEETNAALGAYVRALAKMAGVTLLTATFDGSNAEARLLGATAWPDLGSPEISKAVVQNFINDSDRGATTAATA